MKVLMLAPWKAAIVQRLIVELRKRDIEVILASHHAHSEPDIEDLGSIKSIFSYFQATKVNNLIDKYKPDVIHAHYATHYGVMAALQKKVPYVLALWGSDIMLAPNQGSWLKKFFYKNLLSFVVRKSALCHSSSEHVCQRAMNLSGESQQKFKTFFWGIVSDTLMRPPSRETVDRLDDEYSLADKGVVLCGRGVGELYQPEKVSGIIKYNAKSLADINVIFVVLRVTAKDQDVQKFRSMMLGFEDKYVFVNRMLNEEELSYLYQKSVAHISIPRSDSLGGGVVEPAMWGSYPVLSDLPGNRWFAENYFGAIFREGYTIKDLVKKGAVEFVEDKVVRVRIDMCAEAVILKIVAMYMTVRHRGQ